MDIKLSDSSIVKMKDYWTHRHESTFERIADRGVVYKHDADGNAYHDGVPAHNVDEAYEAVIPLLITEAKDKDGKDIAVNEDWLMDLIESDYKKIRAHVVKLKQAALDEKEAGKKNS